MEPRPNMRNVGVQETIHTGWYVTRTRCRHCGGSRFINNHPCQQCHGRGKTKQRRKINVQVPAGQCLLLTFRQTFILRPVERLNRSEF